MPPFAKLRRSPFVSVLCLLSLLSLWSCDGGTTACTDNGDCREGFICATGQFEGECVQYVPVTTCGMTFCDRVTQSCIDGICVAKVGAGADGLASMPGADASTDAAELGADRLNPGDDGALSSPDLSADLPVDLPAPVVVITAPLEGQSFIDERAVLEGQIVGLYPQSTTSFTVDADLTERALVLDERDHFRVELSLPPGRHTITVHAEQGAFRGPTRVSQAVGFRLDFFVRRRAAGFEMDGAPFRFTGLNTPDLRELAFQAALGGTDLAVEVISEARTLGVRVLRVPACDDRPGARTVIQSAPDTYEEPGLVALDRVIAAAGDAGLKVTLPLVDGTDALGGINQYLRWAGYLAPIQSDKRLFFERGPLREQFKRYVRALLARENTITRRRYGEDPTIFSWEIFTTFDAAGTFAPAMAGAEVADFLGDVSQVIKAASPQALVGTGEVGYDVNPTLYGRAVDRFREVGLIGLFDASHAVAYSRNIRIGTVDYAGLQLVPDALSFPGDILSYSNLGADWIRGHAALAATEGKPLVVSNAALNMAILDAPGRRQALDAFLDEFGALELSGFVVGNFHADAFNRGNDPHGFAWRNQSAVEDPNNELVLVIQGAASQTAPSP